MFSAAVENGRISEDDASKFSNFVNMSGHPTFGLVILAKSGKLAHLERDEGYQATIRVLDALRLGEVVFTQKTSAPVEEQFWSQFDGFYQLTEKKMRKDLPHFITDPSNLAKVQALLDDGEDAAAALPVEETRQIA